VESFKFLLQQRYLAYLCILVVRSSLMWSSLMRSSLTRPPSRLRGARLGRSVIASPSPRPYH
jgi:hypothetical protein